MIVIINSIAFPGLPDIVQKLAARYEAGANLDIHTLTPNSTVPLEEVGRLCSAWEQAGKRHFAFSFSFFSLEALKTLREYLDRFDNEIYAFRLHVSPEALKQLNGTLPASYENWDKAQKQGASKGDMGYAMNFDSADVDTIVQAIWDDIHAPVELVEYDPRWPDMFAREKELILQKLSGLVLMVEHIGSTAIPGMPAKPIIDILIVVENLPEAWKCIQPLQTLGYAFIDYPQNTTRRFYRKGKPRSRHIHIVERGSRPHLDHVNFRDALLSNENLRQEYLRLKQDAMGEFKHRRALYGEKKGALIRKALARFVKRRE
ncbi:MAG: GrpB family protein, partial [bacterium]|nr:GrpB family protein [bacterium]